MVAGFEDFTGDLTQYELDNILPVFLLGWKDKLPGHIINGIDMLKGVNQYCAKHNIYKEYQRLPKQPKPYVLTGPKMRKLAQYIRCHNLIEKFIADGRGYFIAENDEQVMKFLRSLFERANSYLITAQAVMHYNDLTKEEAYKGKRNLNKS